MEVWRFRGLGFRVLEFCATGFRFRVQGFGFRVQDSGFKVSGLGISGFGSENLLTALPGVGFQSSLVVRN